MQKKWDYLAPIRNFGESKTRDKNSSLYFALTLLYFHTLLSLDFAQILPALVIHLSTCKPPSLCDIPTSQCHW